MKAIGNYVIHKEVIGQGQFGTVHQCHLKADKTKIFACKIIVKSKLHPRLLLNLKNEIAILSKI